jgi:hypothetical protein
MAKIGFRGMLADGAEERIKLATIKGKVGYKIVKFQLLPYDPSGSNSESIVKVFKTAIGGGTSLINFTEQDLLAAAFYSGGSGAASPQDLMVIFDNQIFNQDIYINHTDNSSAPQPINYYIELETTPLTDQGAEFTTIQSLRTTAYTT